MPFTLQPKTLTDDFWTSRSELERMFGVSNVRRWADTENTADESLIAANVREAIDDATDEAMSLLSRAPCGQVVVASRTLRRNVTRLAAAILYEARGVMDTADEEGRHRMKYSRDQAYKWFRMVRAGQIDIPGCIAPTNIPYVVPHRVRHGGLAGPRLTPEEVQYANEREEVTGVPTYRWFWGDGFDQFFSPF